MTVNFLLPHFTKKKGKEKMIKKWKTCMSQNNDNPTRINRYMKYVLLSYIKKVMYEKHI